MFPENQVGSGAHKFLSTGNNIHFLPSLSFFLNIKTNSLTSDPPAGLGKKGRIGRQKRGKEGDEAS